MESCGLVRAVSIHDDISTRFLLMNDIVSGVCVPFIMNWGLNKYSFSTMLRAWPIVLVLLAGPLLLYVKPRIPVSPTSYRRPTSVAFLKTSTFWVLQTGNILQGLGFFMPNIYLPSYARALGLSSIAGTVTITLFNSMSVFGQVIRTYILEPLFPDSDHCPGPRPVAGAITSTILPKHISAHCF